jgi:hypothetical protein
MPLVLSSDINNVLSFLYLTTNHNAPIGYEAQALIQDSNGNTVWTIDQTTMTFRSSEDPNYKWQATLAFPYDPIYSGYSCKVQVYDQHRKPLSDGSATVTLT